MLTVMGLAVAGAVLSSIPAQAASSSVIANGVGGSVELVDTNSIPGDQVFVFVSVTHAANVTFFNYNIGDSNFTVSDSGFGSIPASDVTVSGGSVKAGKAIITVNVNTCDVPGFMTLSGTCGPFNVTWNEEPVSVGGFFVTRGDTKFTLFGGGILVINGESANFGALATGTAKGFGSAVPQFGNVFQETNVNVFFSAP